MNVVMSINFGSGTATGNGPVSAWPSAEQPTVTLNNLQPARSPATPAWPTAAGPVTRIATPSNPVPPTGIVGG
jgi:hypothetical protein